MNAPQNSASAASDFLFSSLLWLSGILFVVTVAGPAFAIVHAMTRMSNAPPLLTALWMVSVFRPRTSSAGWDCSRAFFLAAAGWGGTGKGRWL